MASLLGKVAFITGASSGIGRAVAIAYAGAGMRVGLVARRAAELEDVVAACQAAGGEALALTTDVADQAAVQRAVDATVARFGRLDVLVVSAGINVKRRAYDEMDYDEFRRVLDVNVSGLYYATRAALGPMKASGGGLMILVSSMASRRPSTVTGPAYTASKHAVNGLGETLAAFEQRHNIRVTVLSPGVVNTPIMQSRPRPPAREALETQAIQPEDIADICLMLARLPDRATVPVIDIVPTVFPPQ